MRAFRNVIALALGLLTLLAGLAGCDVPAIGGSNGAPTATPAATTDLERAHQVLQTYFNALAAGRYTDAANLYGGDYRSLSTYNPDVGPEDHAKLLERACTANGFKCLKIKDTIQEETLAPDTFRFIVRFQQADGSLFTRPGPVDRFSFVVEKTNDTFLVQGLPVYTQ